MCFFSANTVLPITESVLRGGAGAHPTAGRFQSIASDPYAMEAGTALLRGRPHSVLRARVVFDCAAALTVTWTRLGVRVALGLRKEQKNTRSKSHRLP